MCYVTTEVYHPANQSLVNCVSWSCYNSYFGIQVYISRRITPRPQFHFLSLLGPFPEFGVLQTKVLVFSRVGSTSVTSTSYLKLCKLKMLL